MKNVLIAVSMIPAAAISNATPAAAKQACNDRMIARGLAPDYAVEYMLEFLGLYTMQGRDQLENIAIGECKAEDNSRMAVNVHYQGNAVAFADCMQHLYP
jgi:hypothetical protein